MRDCKVNILGTEYDIKFVDYKSEPCFEKRSIDGYCDSYTKRIRVVNMDTYPGWEDEPEDTKQVSMKETLKHECVHAFLAESGLRDSSAQYPNGWSTFEEMVDWVACQSGKMFRVFQELNIL